MPLIHSVSKQFRVFSLGPMRRFCQSAGVRGWALAVALLGPFTGWSCSVSGSATLGDDCPAGQVLFAGTCVTLCVRNSDCPRSSHCGSFQHCIPADADAAVPRIETINGNGAASPTPGEADEASHRLGSGLILTGENLDATLEGFAVTLLDEAGAVTDLSTMVAASSADRLEVILPTALVDGATYTIRVANQSGSDQASVTVLRGEPGVAGAPGLPGSCTSENCEQTLPGVESLAAIELTAVNDAPGVVANIAVTTGLATVPFVSRSPDGVGGQGFVVVFIQRTPVDRAHTLSVEIADSTNRAAVFSNYAALTAELSATALTSETALALVSFGDVLHVGLGDANERAALYDQLARFGAPAEIYQLGSGDAFAFVGYKDIGEGNGVFVRSSTNRDAENDGALDDGRLVQTVAWLMDRHLFGVSTAQLRRVSSLAASGEVTVGDRLVVGTGVDTGTDGQLTADGTTLVVDNVNNRVGIGTATPATTLDVAGGATVGGALSVTGGAAAASFAGLGIVPVGTILPWHKDLTGVPTLPDGWVECNGQTLSDGASPLNGQVIPDLNGGARFLRGGAASGVEQAESFMQHTHVGGGPHSHDMSSHTHSLSNHVHAGPSHSHSFSAGYADDEAGGGSGVWLRAKIGPDNVFPANGFNSSISAGGTGNTGGPSNNTSGTPSNNTTGTSDPGSGNSATAGTETRPINMSVVWIIRVK